MDYLLSFIFGTLFYCFAVPLVNAACEIVSILTEWLALKVRHITDQYHGDPSIDDYPKPVIGFQSYSPDAEDEEGDYLDG